MVSARPNRNSRCHASRSAASAVSATMDPAPRTSIASSPSAWCHRDQSTFSTEASAASAPVPVPAGSPRGADGYAREGVEADPGPGEPVAQERVRPRLGQPRELDQLVEFAPEPDLLPEH